MYYPPPFLRKRNDLGLIDDGSVIYVYKPDGTIDWRRMVKPEHLVPNKRLTEEKDITKLSDDKLLIVLAGIRDLAAVRGYCGFRFICNTATDIFVSVICEIIWIGNYEQGVVRSFEAYSNIETSAMADATPENTEGFGMKYLTATAENRAFVRCVRNFLNIGVVGEEEVSSVVSPTPISNNPSAFIVLQELMTKKKLSFFDIKAKLVEDKYPEVDKVEKLEDISQVKVFELIKKIQEAKKH